MFKVRKLLFLILIVIGNFSLAFAQTHNLDYYLHKAITNSPLLKDYQNRIRSGQIDSLLIRATKKPHIFANGQVAFYPTINGYGYDKAITNGGNYSGVVSISQPLFNKGILAPQYQQVQIKNLTITNKSKISSLDLNKRITQQYLIAYADIQQIQTNKKVYKLLQGQQPILKALVQNGIYKETDYLTFLSTLQSQEITISQLKLKYKKNLSVLNYLSGIQDTSTVALAEPSLSTNDLMKQDSSVFLRQYQLDSLHIQNQKALVDAQYKANISWFANAGLNTAKLSQAYHNFGAGAGVNFSIPIYDGKRRKLKYQQFKIAEQTRENYASFYHHQYNQQQALLLQQLKGTNSLIQKIKQKLKTLQLLIDVDKKLLNTGDLRITDYMLSIRHYLMISNNLNQTKVSSYQIINKLNYWNH